MPLGAFFTVRLLWLVVMLVATEEETGRIDGKPMKAILTRRFNDQRRLQYGWTGVACQRHGVNANCLQRRKNSILSKGFCDEVKETGNKLLIPKDYMYENFNSVMHKLVDGDGLFGFLP